MANRFKIGDTVRIKPPMVADPTNEKRFIPSSQSTIQGVVRDVRERPNPDESASDPVYEARVDWDDNTKCDQWITEAHIVSSDHKAHKRMVSKPPDEAMRDIGNIPSKMAPAGAGMRKDG